MFKEFAGKLCPVPQSPFSEHDEDRLVHADLAGCSRQQAADELILATVAQALDHQPWRAERMVRLRQIADGRSRRKPA